MRRIHWHQLVAFSLLASACSPPPEQARHAVDEYRANAELRRAQVARCERDPGTLKKTPDCINAQTAAAFEDRLRLRDSPPVGLGEKRDGSAAPLDDEATGARDSAPTPNDAR